MNFDCPLQPVTVLHYQTPPLDTGLIENEMLHLIAGVTTEAEFSPDPSEAMDWRWISIADLQKEIAEQPENYSYWFRIYLQRFDMKAMFKGCA
jgi:isopentenyl-diphosphate delta-isomerase